MFTGIVEEVGQVVSLQGGTLKVNAKIVLEGTRVGDSLSINGACLTATSVRRGSFTVDVIPETLRKTNLGLLQPNEGVNLERALRVDGRLGGHLVQGHVEGTGELLSLTAEGVEDIMAVYKAPRSLMRYIVPKGFIAVDGVSLTVVDCAQETFSVALIPFTRTHTNLAARRPGGRVNLESDIIARYVERLQQPE